MVTTRCVGRTHASAPQPRSISAIERNPDLGLPPLAERNGGVRRPAELAGHPRTPRRHVSGWPTEDQIL